VPLHLHAPRLAWVRRAAVCLASLGAVMLPGCAGTPPAGAGLGSHYGPGPVAIPRSIPGRCSSDVTDSLNLFFSRVAPGTTVVFPKHGCYLVQGTLLVKGARHLHVVGNGATLRRTDPQPDQGWLPHLVLAQDTGVSISGLRITGTYVPGQSPAGHEGHYGIVLRQDQRVRLSHLRVRGISGDFVALFPAPTNSPDQELNQDILVSQSSFDGSGYHGVTIEAADGAVFSGDRFAHVHLDAIDLEYDIYPTVFKDGQPTVAGEDGVTFARDRWSDCGGVWLASLQGQGVQEDDLRIVGNVLHSSPFSVQITGNRERPNRGLVISGNTSDTPTGGPPGVAGVILRNVEDVVIEGNRVPFFDGTPTYFHNHPFHPAIALEGVVRAVVQGNRFPGASSTLEARPPGYGGTGNVAVRVCANRFGPGDAREDSSGPSCPR
jgi:hypothetical protein